MDEKQHLQQIAVLLQKRYNGLNEIENITKQLQEALGYNDVVSIRMLITMRQQEMDSIDLINADYKASLEGLTEVQKKALKTGNTRPFSGENAAMVQKIAEIQQKNTRLLERLIEQDQRVNRKLAGENSYYQQGNQ